jgi:hypothetical protein
MGRSARAAVVAVAGVLFWVVASISRVSLDRIEGLALIVWLATPFLLLAAWIEADGLVTPRRKAALVIAFTGSALEAIQLRQQYYAAVALLLTTPMLVAATAVVAGRPRARSRHDG